MKSEVRQLYPFARCDQFEIPRKKQKSRFGGVPRLVYQLLLVYLLILG
jgi:hypothetical protein